MKNRNKKWLSVLLALVMVCSLLPVWSAPAYAVPSLETDISDLDLGTAAPGYTGSDYAAGIQIVNNSSVTLDLSKTSATISNSNFSFTKGTASVVPGSGYTGSPTEKFIIAPVSGLGVGDYSAYVELYYDADGDETYETLLGSLDVTFKVAEPPATTYTLKGVTAAFTGAAYMDYGELGQWWAPVDGDSVVPAWEEGSVPPDESIISTASRFWTDSDYSNAHIQTTEPQPGDVCYSHVSVFNADLDDHSVDYTQLTAANVAITIPGYSVAVTGIVPGKINDKDGVTIHYTATKGPYTLTGVTLHGTGYEKDVEGGGVYKPKFSGEGTYQWADSESSDLGIYCTFFFTANSFISDNYLLTEPAEGETYYFKLFVFNTESNHDIDFAQVDSSKVNVSISGFELTLIGNEKSGIEGPLDAVALTFSAKKVPPATYGITVNGGVAKRGQIIDSNMVYTTITEAAEGDYVCAEPTTVAEGKWYSFSSDDVSFDPEQSGMVGKYSSCGFTMPAKAVTITVVENAQTPVTVDLTVESPVAPADFFVAMSCADVGDRSTDSGHANEFDLDNNGSYDIKVQNVSGTKAVTVLGTNSISSGYKVPTPGYKNGPYTFKLPVTKYPVWVGSTQLTEENIDGVAIPGVKFDPETYTLTLNDPTIIGSYKNGLICFNPLSDDPTVLKIDGSATLGDGSTKIAILGIESTIELNGSFDCTGTEEGIGAFYVTVSGGTIKASGGVNGIDAENTITISGGKVTAIGGKNGICSESEDVIISGGEVTAKATGSDGVRGGIKSNKNIKITAGTVTATSTQYALLGSKITVSGGTVTATGDRFGISQALSFEINGGTLEATGKEVRAFDFSSVTVGTGMDVLVNTAASATGATAWNGSDYLGGDTPDPFKYVKIAPEAEKYPVWVAGTQLTEENIDGVAIPGVKYDPATYTLTLTSANINAPYNEVGILAKGIDLVIEGSGLVSAENRVGIVVKEDDGSGGNLTINADLIAAGIVGISVSNKLTVKGGEVTVTLKASASTAVSAGAVDIQGGSITATSTGDRAFKVTGDFSVSAGEVIAKNGSFGIDAGGKVTISGGKVTAKGSTCAILGGNDITVSGGTVTADGGDNGIETSKTLTVSGGTVTADGGKKGIVAGTLTVSGGTVKATGSEEGTGDGSGIYAGSVAISNAAVTAKGRVYGVYSMGDISVSGNTLEAETWVENESQAICAEGDLTISGGTVTTKTAATGLRSKKNIKIENGTQKVEADAKKHAVWADTALEIGDKMMIKKPTDGINDGNNIYEAGGVTEAVYALIVPKVVSYPVWVGSTQLTSENIDGSTIPGVKFDPETYTLTLTDPSVTTLHSGNAIHSQGIDLTVEGSAALAVTDAYAGIYAEDGALTIKGDISATGSNYGLFAGKDLSVESGTVTATGKYGAYAGAGALSVAGTLAATGTDNEGVYADKGVTVSGSLTAKGALSGVYTSGDVSLSGTVDASGSGKYGIFSDGNITISGGSVKADGSGDPESCGIYAAGNITISGGTVTATTGTGIGTTAIYSKTGDISISGGTVTAKGDAGGILAKSGSVDIADGITKVEADGGTVAIRGETGLTIGDALEIREPAGGTVEVISSGSTNVMDGTDVARHALIVPKTAETFTVTYKVVNGTWSDSTSADKTETVVSGASPASVPTGMIASSGYTGGAWDTDPASATITADTTFTYSFTAVTPVTTTFTVSFDANGHGTAPAAQTVEDGKTATKPADPTESGWTFGGWYKEAACTNAFDFSAAITADITLYAKWTEDSVTPPSPTKYTVSFDANGHGTAPAAQTVEDGKTATKPADPTESGWTFGGWYTEAACTTAFDFSAAITSDITLYAKWTEDSVTPPSPTKYTVSFDANGHGTAPAAQTVEDGKTATKPADPTESGWTFGGWYTEAACTTAFDFSAAITADITLYAKWTEEAAPAEVVYTVTSGGDGAWTKGDGSLTIVVKRAPDDENCFSHFAGVQLGGETLTNGTDYSAVAGSTVVTIKSAFLEKLPAGVKTITVLFDDGKAETKLTIKAAASSATSGSTASNSPKTGDERNTALWAVLACFTGVGMCVVTGLQERRKTRKR